MAGGGDEHNVQLFKMAPLLFKEYKMCQTILKYMLTYRRNGPDKLNI